MALDEVSQLLLPLFRLCHLSYMRSVCTYMHIFCLYGKKKNVRMNCVECDRVSRSYSAKKVTVNIYYDTTQYIRMYTVYMSGQMSLHLFNHLKENSQTVVIFVRKRIS